MDERGTRELLEFARSYAERLVFYGDDDVPNGNWRGLFGDLSSDAILRFMEEPQRFDAQSAPRFYRPHFTLFLVFLRLLEEAREEMNGFTRRHLNHHFQEVLEARRKDPRADRVHVQFEPSPGAEDYLVLRGTRLDAGEDAEGNALNYRTLNDLVVNAATVAEVRSLSVDYAVETLEGVRRRRRGSKGDAAVRQLELALGQPNPGDPAPEEIFVRREGEGEGEDDPYRALVRTRQVLDFAGAPEGLNLEFHELEELIQRLERRRAAEPLGAVVAKLPDGWNTEEFYHGVEQVRGLEDLYLHRRRERSRVFIDEHFGGLEEFEGVVRRKSVIEDDYRAINALLDVAGRRKREREGQPSPEEPPRPDLAIDDFQGRLEWNLGAIRFDRLPGRRVADLVAYRRYVADLEAGFSMTAEDALFVLRTLDAFVENEAGDEGAPRDDELQLLDEILGRARVTVARRGRVESLRTMWAEVPAERAPAERMQPVLARVLGRRTTVPGRELLDGILALITGDEDRSLVEAAWNGAGVGEEVLAPDDRPSDEPTSGTAPPARVLAILEAVWTQREGGPNARPEVRRWVDCYASADPRQLPSHRVSGSTSAWRTFGKGDGSMDDLDREARLGFAVQSPLLELSGGRRTIRLEIEGLVPTTLRELYADPSLLQALAGELHTEEGWVPVQLDPTIALSRPGDGPLSGITLGFTVTADELAPITAPADGCGALRFVLQPIYDAELERPVREHDLLAGIRVATLRLTVDVDGLEGVLLGNDEDGDLDGSKPFEPFGSEPLVGSNFYLGHHELLPKRLSRLVFDVDWHGVPPGLESRSYYVRYPSIARSKFRVRIDNQQAGLRKTVGDRVSMFKGSRVDGLLVVQLPSSKEGIPGVPPVQAAPLAARVRDLPSYYRWTLTDTDFGHREFPSLSAKEAARLAADLAKDPNKVDPEQYTIPPPYTPTVARIALGYSATDELGGGPGPAAQGMQLQHLHPFGWTPAHPGGEDLGATLVPVQAREGDLYLGLSGVDAPTVISLFFQMAEGTADPSARDGVLTWSFLSGNRWVEFSGNTIQEESTRGFVNSGVVRLALGKVEPSTLMPPGWTWIRASIDRDAEGVCDIVGIHAQAVTAQLDENGVAPAHYGSPLPPGTIEDLVEPVPEIAKVHQPYSSFGGAPGEADDVFYTRFSERLRHKGRALSPWDYEHLVLEHFPSIYKAKCIPGDLGRVDVVIIPDIRDRIPSDPFEPLASAQTIREVEQFLALRAPAEASVRVRNASYVPVKVRVGVRFRERGNDGFYAGELRRELGRFLSPWAYDEAADIVMGGEIHATNLVDFIERRPYVDYVADLKLFKSEDGTEFEYVPPPREFEVGYTVAAEEAHQVLVASRHHEIDVVPEKGYEARDFLGIGYMRIQLDFVVGEGRANGAGVGNAAIGEDFIIGG